MLRTLINTTLSHIKGENFILDSIYNRLLLNIL